MADTLALSGLRSLELLHELVRTRPPLPQDFVDLLGRARAEVLECPPDPELAREYGEHVLYLWETAWPVLQSLDILEETSDGSPCACLSGAVFALLSSLVHTGVLAGSPRINITLLAGSPFGRQMLYREDGHAVVTGWTDMLSLKHIKRLLYYISKQWFAFTYGHHEVLQEIFPALLTRLTQLFEDPEQDENMLWVCEAYLRCMWWPMVVRGYFNVRALCDVERYDEDVYCALLGAVNAWVEDLMAHANHETLARFKIEVVQKWELPCAREILSRTTGTARAVISDDQIMKMTPTSLQMERLERVTGDNVFADICAGPNDQIRQRLILINVLEDVAGDLDDAVKDWRHLWDKEILAQLALSRQPYLLQMAGSYMAVCDGHAYISRTIEEALAQFLFLSQESNMLRSTLLTAGYEPAADASSAYLTHLHESSAAVVL